MLKSLPLDNSAFTLGLRRLLPKSKKSSQSFWSKNPDHALMVFGADQMGPHPLVGQRLLLNKKRKNHDGGSLVHLRQSSLARQSSLSSGHTRQGYRKINRTLVKKKVQEVIVIIELSSLAYPYALHPKDETGKLAPHEIAIALNSVSKETHIKLGCLCDAKINEFFKKPNRRQQKNVAVMQTAASIASLLLELLR